LAALGGDPAGPIERPWPGGRGERPEFNITTSGRCLMRVETERKMRRWREQRWLLDQVIQTRGLDWDQGRTGKILRNCGPGAAGELQEIGRRVQKFSDIPREFSRAARRREDLAAEAEQAGHQPEAAEHYGLPGVGRTSRLRRSKRGTSLRRRSTITSRQPTTPTRSGRSMRTITRSGSPGGKEKGFAMTNSSSSPADLSSA